MRFCVLFLILIGVVAGCGTRSPVPPEREPGTVQANIAQNDPNTPDPHAILKQMAMTYRIAFSYSDRANIQIIGTMSPNSTAPTPRNCAVVFQRPNQLYLEINEGTFVSDGINCYAQVRSLPDQVLHFPAPMRWTLETLFQDVHFDAATTLGLPPSVLRFAPQLILLFADDPLNTFIPRGATVEWIRQQPIDHAMCDVVEINHLDGSRILWICQDNNALLRMDYRPVGLPIPEDFESIEVIRIELTDARFNGFFTHETFQIRHSPDALRVAEFLSDSSSVLPTAQEHRLRLQMMADSDIYRLAHPNETMVPTQRTSPRAAPTTFTLTQLWSQPLVGASTMAFSPRNPPQLFIPYEGNLVAVVDLQGNVLQRIEPEGLENTIVMGIRCSLFSEKQRIGILTLDRRFHLFDESFQPLAVWEGASDDGKKENVQDFLFFPHYNEELLLLAMQQEADSGLIRAMDTRGMVHWEHSFAGIPNQIASGVMDGWWNSVLVSRTTSQDSILILSSDGEVTSPVEIPFGRYAIWFHVLGSTIYALLENEDTGDVRFAGLDRQGKSLWSRLLPPGEYEVDPVFVWRERRWLVPSPNGEILVFDQIGNLLDTFSLDRVPTGLLSAETSRDTLLIIADGEAVSAWKMQ